MNQEAQKIHLKQAAKQALVNQAISGKMAQQAQEAIFDRQAYRDTLKNFNDSLDVYKEAHQEGRLSSEDFGKLSKAIEKAQLDFDKEYRAGNKNVLPKSIGLIEIETGVRPQAKPRTSKMFGVVAEDGTTYYKMVNVDYLGNVVSESWMDDAGNPVADHRLKQITQSHTSSFYIGDTPYMGPSTFGAMAGLPPSMIAAARQELTAPKTSSRSSSTVTKKGGATSSGPKVTPGTSGGAVRRK